MYEQYDRMAQKLSRSKRTAYWGLLDLGHPRFLRSLSGLREPVSLDVMLARQLAS